MRPPKNWKALIPQEKTWVKWPKLFRKECQNTTCVVNKDCAAIPVCGKHFWGGAGRQQRDTTKGSGPTQQNGIDCRNAGAHKGEAANQKTFPLPPKHKFTSGVLVKENTEDGSIQIDTPTWNALLIYRRVFSKDLAIRSLLGITLQNLTTRNYKENHNLTSLPENTEILEVLGSVRNSRNTRNARNTRPGISEIQCIRSVLSVTGIAGISCISGISDISGIPWISGISGVYGKFVYRAPLNVHIYKLFVSAPRTPSNPCFLIGLSIWG